MIRSKLGGKRVYLTIFAIVSLFIEGFWALKEMRIGVPEAALSGDTVTLSCEYNLEEVALYSIKWYWNDEEFYRYVPKESPPFRAFSVTFADFNVDIIRSGSTEVTLRNISREMTGDYKCEVSADAPLFHTDIQAAHMIVLDPPRSNPKIIIEEPPESTMKIEIGKIIKAGCFAPWGPGNNLSPNVTWFLNDEPVKSDDLSARIYPAEVIVNKTIQEKITKSTLEIVTKKLHFSRGILKVRCQESIYSVWKKSVERYFKEESPQLAPVLGSTSSQSHTNQVVEIITNSSGKNTSSTRVLLFFCFILFKSIFSR
ncbi:uncharacterized protein LOC130893781 isoform X1 [Diorhabda carinulata]|uniref:uncharacterized protein LOC130893781 isoform X1 n=2 Tax=Diorhabda carinulata TaxID=1163345 RepID=UPI0025A180A6|nr:uncharacterized protein LOC130893781 isoform X1 [Diorhabda carinulata]XP_057656131.1 uncharacterized protein LOC130893781 isoform X1 [Diorhabda carinulata]XP_057656132.1 uncharacterized protein LOC130893781 isoform X1 [Diorhabda carinulata]XP_057656133.1 uncharacterized protein LOC130893781 isoform X1 [Diorhabda carinulata]